jgi:hypothetical protein
LASAASTPEGTGGWLPQLLVEDYVQRFPALSAAGPHWLTLIREEYRVRRCWGDWPDRGDYLARFPALRAQLEPLLQLVEEQLAAEGITPPAAAAPPDAIPVAQTALPVIPGYEVLGELGQGGMGVVYQARHLALKRLVALKMIQTADPDDAYRARFLAEAEAVARLQHPNIVQIHAIGEYAGKPFLALEFVDGGSLRQKLAGTPMPATEAAQLVETLARAMAVVHQRGLVHRDLKPANVLLTANGIPKVSDFGLVKLLDVDTGQTQTGQIMGTPSYMAPEQARGQVQQIGPAADVYSLGAVLYETLTGRPPFRAATIAETLQQVREQDPVPPRRLLPSVPRDLETICLRCLAREPRQRYRSAAELADDLRRFLHGEPIRARPTGRVERAWKWARRHPARAALAGLSGLAVLLAVYLVTAWQYNAELSQKNLDLDQARLEAEKLRRLAEEQRSQRYRYQHVAAVNALNGLWRDGYQFGVRDELARLAPQPGEEDLRGFEWFFLQRMTEDLRLIETGTEGIRLLALAPQGGLVASGGRDRRVRLLDLASGRTVRILDRHRLPITALAFSPDGKRLASVASDWERPGPDNEIKVWEVSTGREAASARASVGLFAAVAYSPDGRRLATGDLDGRVAIWETRTGARLLVLSGPARIVSVAFSSDGSRLASGAGDGQVRLWDTHPARPRR